MKKIVCFIICIFILVALSSCGSALSKDDGSSLPKGDASRIDFTDGWSIKDASFEYVNERTVKIVREVDGQVFYVPDSSIDMIWVK